MRIDVVNPWGRDAPVDWRAGLTPPGAAGHPPINYWAWAAATGGQFHQTPETVGPEADAVVVLLRWRTWTNWRAVHQLKARGLKVFVSWKESGRAQVAAQLRQPWHRAIHRATLALADGAFAASPDSAAHYRAFGLAPEAVVALPTPYPFDEPGWDFARPVAERDGIVVGTRQFDVASRRHVEALQLAGRIARASGCRLTVFNVDGEAGRLKIRQAVGAVARLELIEQRLAYPAFLGVLAAHRLVIQRDAGGVPGQIAGDSLLSGIVNIGGDGAIQRLAWPDLSEPAADEAALEAAALRLLADDATYLAACADGRTRADAAGASYGGFRRVITARLASAPPD